jgi:hypothetical protein
MYSTTLGQNPREYIFMALIKSGRRLWTALRGWPSALSPRDQASHIALWLVNSRNWRQLIWRDLTSLTPQDRTGTTAITRDNIQTGWEENFQAVHKEYRCLHCMLRSSDCPWSPWPIQRPVRRGVGLDTLRLVPWFSPSSDPANACYIEHSFPPTIPWSSSVGSDKLSIEIID